MKYYHNDDYTGWCDGVTEDEEGEVEDGWPGV